MKQRIEKVQEQLGSFSPDAKVDTFVLVWIEDSKYLPPGRDFCFQHNFLGRGNNVADDKSGISPVQYRKLMEKNPEVIISTAYGYSTPEQVKEVLNLDNLAAVKNDKIYIVEDADLLSLPDQEL